jgi:hypothetical protein
MLWWASITDAEDEVDMVVLCIVLNDGVPKGPKGGQLQGKATCSGRSTVRPKSCKRARSPLLIIQYPRKPGRGARQAETYHIVQYAFVYNFIMLDPSGEFQHSPRSGSP